MDEGTRDIFCDGCGENLSNQQSGECPECGSEFSREQGVGIRDTPEDPRRSLPHKSRPPVRAGILLGLSLIGIFLYVVLQEPRLLYLALVMGLFGVGDILFFFLGSHSNRG